MTQPSHRVLKSDSIAPSYMQLEVSTTYNKLIKVVAFKNEDIWKLKKRIELIEGYPAEVQALYFDGKELTNS